MMCYCTPNRRTPFCPDCTQKMFLRINELTKQRDELAAFIQGWLERQGDDVSYMTEKARAALAAVKDRGNAKVSGVPPHGTERE